MTSTDLYQRIAALLGQIDSDLGHKTEAELQGKYLGEDLGLDSLDVVRFILLVEEGFGRKLPDEDIDKQDLLRVDKLVAYLARAE